MIAAVGLLLACGTGLWRILRPRRFFAVLTDASCDSGTSPFTGLTMALAGTLGVGNITGVAAAVVSGGAGAVFWMWAGAVLAMSIKYGEVALAVKYRREEKGVRFGGAMYYICDGLGRRFPGRSFSGFGSFFAVLCILNSMITGNIVQSNSAADVVHTIPSYVTGIVLAALVAVSAVFGVNRIGRITSRLIPVLTGVYLILALYIFIAHIAELPSVLAEIVKSAFSFRAAAGGAVGITAREAVRFGVTRGIFSNEAGCGTSPTAHASANTKSPFHQGCYGIFEVAADTLVLCSVTAFVLLTADRKFGILSGAGEDSGASLTLRAFSLLTGEWAYGILAAAVLLFAYATVLAQLYYGFTALGYLTKSRTAKGIYLVLSVGCTFFGAVADAEFMWTAADLIVCGMTVINLPVLWILRKEIYGTVRDCSGNLSEKAKKPLI